MAGDVSPVAMFLLLLLFIVMHNQLVGEGVAPTGVGLRGGEVGGGEGGQVGVAGGCLAFLQNRQILTSKTYNIVGSDS